MALELLSGVELLSVAANKMRYYYNIISSQQEAQLALVTMEIYWHKALGFKATTMLHNSMSLSLKKVLERISYVLMMPSLARIIL
jgi:hypothetical protein